MRGDLYRLKAPKDTRGHEQAGGHYAVVVQSDDLPLSTWTTRVLVEQLTVVDPQKRLGEFAGRLSSDELRAVDEALLAVLALD